MQMDESILLSRFTSILSRNWLSNSQNLPSYPKQNVVPKLQFLALLSSVKKKKGGTGPKWSHCLSPHHQNKV